MVKICRHLILDKCYYFLSQRVYDERTTKNSVLEKVSVCFCTCHNTCLKKFYFRWKCLCLLLQAKYDESQAARREKVLPLVHSDPKFYGHGVQHLAHSKSDANFLGSGLSNGTGASANGHILLQEWQQSDEGLVLLPVASRSFPERHLRSSDIKHIHEPSVHLHSRNIYNVWKELLRSMSYCISDGIRRLNTHLCLILPSEF